MMIMPATGLARSIPLVRWAGCSAFPSAALPWPTRPRKAFNQHTGSKSGRGTLLREVRALRFESTVQNFERSSKETSLH